MDKRIQLPNGEIAVFPEGMTDEQIAAVIRRQFLPEPAPASAFGRVPEDVMIDAMGTPQTAGQPDDSNIIDRFGDALGEAYGTAEGVYAGLTDNSLLRDDPRQFYIERLLRLPYRAGAAVAAGGIGLLDAITQTAGQSGEEITGIPREELVEAAEVAALANPISAPLPLAVRSGRRQIARSSRQQQDVQQPNTRQIEDQSFVDAEIIDPADSVSVDDLNLAPTGLVGRAGRFAAAPAEALLTGLNKAVDTVFPQGGAVNARLSEALRLDGINIRDIAQRAREFQNRTGRRPTLLQLGGENIELLGSQVALGAGEARPIIQQYRQQVLDLQTDQVRDVAKRTLSRRRTDYLQDIDNLEEQIRNDAAPLYDQLRLTQYPVTEELRSLLDTPSGVAAFKRARRIMSDERMSPETMGMIKTEDGKWTLGDQINGGVLDYIKRGLDDVVEKNKDSTTQRLSAQGVAASGLRRSFINEADSIAPLYKAARDAYAGPASLRSALIDGRKMLKSSKVRIEDVSRTVDAMNSSEKEFYRAGILQGIVDILQDGVADTNRVRRLVRSNSLRDKLRASFDNPEMADSFIEELIEMEELSGRVQRVSPTTGSLTASRMAGRRDFGKIQADRNALLSIASATYDRLRQQRNLRNEQIVDRDIATIITQPLSDEILDEITKRVGN